MFIFNQRCYVVISDIIGSPAHLLVVHIKLLTLTRSRNRPTVIQQSVNIVEVDINIDLYNDSRPVSAGF